MLTAEKRETVEQGIVPTCRFSGAKMSSFSKGQMDAAGDGWTGAVLKGPTQRPREPCPAEGSPGRRRLHGWWVTKEGEHRGGASEGSQSGQGAIPHPRW